MSHGSDAGYEMRKRREAMRKETRQESESILVLAALRIDRMFELANGYWPDSPDYDDVRRPWWLALTDIGPIRLGWRKRVLEIEWGSCVVRAIVTEDEVTKNETLVHAYTTAKAVEYLTALRLRDEEQRRERAKP